jgi:hypothetical protein
MITRIKAVVAVLKERIRQFIVKRCLIIAGNLDKLAVKNCAIGVGFSANLQKVIPPDGKYHEIGVTYMANIMMAEDKGKIQEGKVTRQDIRVYRDGKFIGGGEFSNVKDEFFINDIKLTANEETGPTLSLDLEPEGIQNG